MIEENMKNWHLHLKGEFPGGLDELLADDCIFFSPVVFTPQKGKALTKLYLGAAGNTFSGGDKEKAPGCLLWVKTGLGGPRPECRKLRYKRKSISGDWRSACSHKRSVRPAGQIAGLFPW